MEGAQAAILGASLELRTAEPSLQELARGNYAMLPSRELGYVPISLRQPNPPLPTRPLGSA